MADSGFKDLPSSLAFYRRGFPETSGFGVHGSTADILLDHDAPVVSNLKNLRIHRHKRAPKFSSISHLLEALFSDSSGRDAEVLKHLGQARGTWRRIAGPTLHITAPIGDGTTDSGLAGVIDFI